ncbi:MAG: type II secretion system protein, partial [Fimbriiglobus sp.]
TGRRGFTLIETLFAFVVAGFLTAFAMVAVQRTRSEAARIASMNNLRQIAIGTNHFTDVNGGRLPFHNFLDIWPYVGIASVDKKDDFSYPQPVLRSPADQTIKPPTLPPNGSYAQAGSMSWGNISYAANKEVFATFGRETLTGCSDGLSCVIAYGERYANCNETAVIWGLGNTVVGSTYYGAGDPDPSDIPSPNPSMRGPTFSSAHDVMPVSGPDGTGPSVPGVTFQVRPAAGDCDYRQLQTPHSGGMLTAYLDGSVRTTSAGVSPAVFWAAVTPAGRDGVGEP